MNFFLMEFVNYISVIPSIVIFGISCYFLSKRNCTEALLLVIGSGLDIILSLFYMVVVPYLANGDTTNSESLSQYYTIGNVVRLAANVFFALGFFTLIKNLFKTDKIVSKNPFNNIND